jgi:feruloyl esterase
VLTIPRNTHVCRFDVAAAMCKPKQIAADCLTPAQITAARKIYLGPHSPTGERIFRGFEPGSESNAVDWPEWLVGTSSSTPGTQNKLSRAFWCDEVLGHSRCPLLQIKEAFGDTTRNIASVVNATDPDLSPFKDHGGKLIQYAGWADAAIPPQSGLDYYAKVAIVMGDVHSFYRVFMAPGMGHCYGGAGANAFGNGPNDGPIIDAKHDLLKALELWVERGIAPETIIATKYVGDSPRKGIAFQRPLCPYPKFAKYNGYGRATDTNSFKCVIAERH